MRANSYSDTINDYINWLNDALKNGLFNNPKGEWHPYGEENCCVENRRTSKEYQYIVTFLLDGREKTLTQKGPSIEQVKVFFNNLMREFCPNEFRGWNNLEIISIKRREIQ